MKTMAWTCNLKSKMRFQMSQKKSRNHLLLNNSIRSMKSKKQTKIVKNYALVARDLNAPSFAEGFVEDRFTKSALRLIINRLEPK